MEDATIQDKQLYLSTEIIKKGYDPQKFSNFLSDQKGEEKIDLEYWSMEDLKKAVSDFKKLIRIENKKILSENPPEETLKRRHSSVDKNKSKNNKNDDEDNYDEKSILTQHKKNKNKNKNKKNNIIKGEPIILFDNNFDLNENNIIDNNNIINNDKDVFNNKIKCKKLEENEITNRDDLYIEITLQDEIKNNIISNSSKIIVETKPIGFKTIRKIQDFEYLYQKLYLINSEKFNTLFYINKNNSIDFFSKESFIYLKLYINSLIQSPFFRTLPFFYHFITLSLEDWEKIKKEKYIKLTQPHKREKMPNLEGYFNLKMESGDEEKCLKIKDELNLKNESFIKLQNSFDELSNLMDKKSLILKNIKKTISELRNRYNNNSNMINLFAHIEIIIKVWIEGSITRKNFINNEINYFFKYMNMENNSFLKYYNNFDISYNAYKSKFEKMNKKSKPSEKDKLKLKDLKKEVIFKLVNINSEYKKLNENQAKRIENKLCSISNSKNIIFQDMESITDLLNIFNIKKTAQDINEENEEKENISNKKDENNIKENNESKIILNKDEENNNIDKK